MNKLSLFILFFVLNLTALSQTSDTNLLKQAKELHQRILTLDSHVDTPSRFTRDTSINIGKRNDKVKVDLTKMEEGKLDAVFFAIYHPQGLQTDSALSAAYLNAKKQLENIYYQVEKNSDRATVATNLHEALQAKKEGKRAIFIGVENAYCLGTDKLSAMKEFYSLGARYITLCHTKASDVCYSSGETGEDTGLTDFGKELISEMNRLGMLIDLSHASDQTVRDVIACSKTPVVATHSSVRNLYNHPRNLSDELIRLIADNGGVIQVSIWTGFLKSKEDGRATVSDVVDHIDYIVSLVGIDHVGFGSDFDGGGGVVGCEDASGIINITVEMLRRNYTEIAIEKFWSLNFFRILEQAEQVAACL
ncbi:MAG: dipeptidase [Prevotellaceae bacterium]|jgi:microsomal dipeptidase-like Zn-dependent dipeptidase|nr:dipeptidase [Prevotellaceae bacterium]